MRIGIDIMGGDYAPKKTVQGAVLAQNELPKNTTLVLFGEKEKILSELKNYEFNQERIEIINCSESISMHEHATKAFRAKPNSSISKGFKHLAQEKIDGFQFHPESFLTTNGNLLIKKILSA